MAEELCVMFLYYTFHKYAVVYIYKCNKLFTGTIDTYSKTSIAKVDRTKQWNCVPLFRRTSLTSRSRFIDLWAENYIPNDFWWTVLCNVINQWNSFIKIPLWSDSKSQYEYKIGGWQAPFVNFYWLLYVSHKSYRDPYNFQFPISLGDSKFHGIPWNYWRNRKKETQSSMEFFGILFKSHIFDDMNASTVYPKKYAHGFVVLCFVLVMRSFIINSHEVFIHIHQGCFAGTGAIVRLPQCQWSKPDG